jgi:hypothetical protein
LRIQTSENFAIELLDFINCGISLLITSPSTGGTWIGISTTAEQL